MSIVRDIAKAVSRLRHLSDVDIERLSYELNESEWDELGRELSSGQIDISYLNKLNFMHISKVDFMGLTIRKVPAQSAEDIPMLFP